MKINHTFNNRRQNTVIRQSEDTIARTTVTDVLGE